MHPRAAFRISLATGLLVLAVTLFSATQEPVRPCGNLPQNCLMNLTPQLDPASLWFALLPWATGIKWLGLGVAAAIAAAIYVKSAGARVWNLLAALLCAAAFLSTVAAIAVPSMFGPLVGLGVALSWLAYLVTAGAAAFRPMAGAAELPRPG
ncbi:MAG: hypothetical protein ACREXP_03145 [Steroidobacteraceae bacterium]